MNKKSLFMDRAVISVVAGRGGNGISHFRREKYVPLGGPDGGDGGRGGSVILVADEGLKTLVDFSYRRQYEAESGAPGSGNRKSGKSAQDCLIKVPVGTLALGRDGELIADLREHGQQAVVAKGGRGGLGNIHFATALRRAPRLAEKGEPGEERELILELKLLADVGIIGLPNAGKSTLLAAVSAATPKIADYPFTTLTPNLGRVRIDEGASFVMVDIPGLIEGAADGAGLGHEFLRHVERTRLLVHLLDAGTPGADPEQAFTVVNQELARYDRSLAKRPQIVALNKLDLIADRTERERWTRAFAKRGLAVFGISAATRAGVKELVQEISDRLKDLPIPVLRAEITSHPKAPVSRFTLVPDGPGRWKAGGKEVEKWVAMTDFENEEAVAKLKNIFDRIGLSDAFKQAGLRPGDTVRVGKEEFVFQEDSEQI